MFKGDPGPRDPHPQGPTLIELRLLLLKTQWGHNQTLMLYKYDSGQFKNNLKGPPKLIMTGSKTYNDMVQKVQKTMGDHFQRTSML